MTKVASIVTEGARAEIGKVVGVEIDKLRGVVAIFLDLWHGEDKRFGPQIHPNVGIGSVGVRSDDKFVIGCCNRFGAIQVLKSPRKSETRLVDGLLVHGVVVHNHWEAVDVGLLGNGTRVAGGDARAGWLIGFRFASSRIP